MELLERAIAALSPKWAAERMSWRSALETLRTSAPIGRYEAARLDRSLDGWRTPGTSANAEIRGQLVRLRNRARDLGRNNPYIARAYDVITSKIVGPGIRPRLPPHVNAQTRRRTMERFEEWAERVGLYAKQRLAVRTMVESGEALLAVTVNDTVARGENPVDFRVLEPDWIDLDREGINSATGNMIVQGVEIDEQDKPVAYYVFDQHPGDWTIARGAPGSSRRVPAEMIIRLYDHRRPQQLHGVPWVAPVATLAKHLDDINDARLKRAKITACFAAFVTRPEAVVSTPLGKTEIGEDRRRREQVAPAMIDYLSPGEDVKFAVPPRGEQDEAWQTFLLHGIATGMGLTYAQITGDLREANYSSMRGGVLDQWPLLDQWQHLIVTPGLAQPIWAWFDRYDAAMHRRAPITGVEHQYPERMFVDPNKDGAAQDAALKAGRKSWTEVIEARGLDPERFAEQLRRERASLEELNLPHMRGAMRNNPEQRSIPAGARANAED